MGATVQRVRRPVSCLIFAAAAVFSARDLARATAVSWAVDADGQWTTPENWSINALPGSGDDVTISRTAAAFNITLASGTQSINSFIANNNLTIDGGSLTIAAPSQTNGAFSLINGGTLFGAGDLTINGPFLFNGGLGGPGRVTLNSSVVTTLSGPSTTLATRLDNFGVVVSSSALSFLFQNATFNNSGRFEVSDMQLANTSGSNAFNNLAAGVVDKFGTANFQSSIPFNNAGVVNVFSGFFNVSSGTNTGTINVNSSGTFGPASAYINSGTINFNGGSLGTPLNNAGNVFLNSGRLTMTGGGINAGTIHLAPGTTLNLIGNYSAAAGSLITGGGGVSFSGSIPTFAGSVNVTGPVVFNSGLTFTGNQTFTGAVTLNSSAVLSGPADLTIAGPFSYAGILTGTGNTILSATSVTTLGSSVSISRPIDNSGYFNCALSVPTLSNTSFHNLSTGTFVVSSSLNFNNSAFANAGLFIENTFSAAFNNSGGSNVFTNSGTFQLNGGAFTSNIPFNNTGVIQASSLAAITFAGGGSNLGSINFGALGTASTTSAFVNSGSINFLNGGGMTGTVSGAGSINAMGGILSLLNATLASGTVNVSSGATLILGFGDVVNVPATITGGGAVSFSGSMPSFGGTLSSTGSIGIGGSGVSFSGNQTFTGAVNLNSTLSGTGDITIAGPFSYAGTLSGTGKTTLASTSVTMLGTSTTMARSLSNAGYFNANNNTLTLNANFNNLAGGTYNTTNSLTFTGGSFSNAGTFIEGAFSPTFSNQSGAGQFTNSGTFLYNGGGGLTSNVPFNNSGVFQTSTTATSVTFASGGVNTGNIFFPTTGTASTTAAFVNSGTISFLNSGVLTGTIGGSGSINVLGGNVTASNVTMTSGSVNVSPGANLVLGFGAVVNSPVTISGAGGVSFAGSIGTFAGTLASTGLITIGNSVSFAGSQTFTGAVSLTGSGAIAGPGDISIAGPFSYSGPMSGTGRTILMPGSTTVIASPSTATLGRTLNNFGTVNYSSSNNFILSSGIFNNSGVFNADNSASITTGTTPDTFNNLAGSTFNVSSPVNTFSITADFNNAGVVNVFIGAMSLNGGSNSGTFNLYPNASLTLASFYNNSGTVNLYPGSTFSGSIAAPGLAAIQSGSASLIGISTYSGTLSVAAGATAVINSTFTAQPSFKISGAGSVVFNASGPNTFAGTFANGGQVTVNGSLNLIGLPTLAKPLNVNGSLEISAPGPSPLAAVRAMLVSGYNGGAWNGPGINSSAAHGSSNTALGYGVASDLGYANFGGTPTAPNTVLVKYTYYGDSSLDGKVDLGNDFNLFLEGFVATSASSWELGDYNYDGKVDMTDLTLFLDGYAGQGGNLGQLDGIIAGMDELTASQKSTLLSVVPEPSSVLLISTLACATLAVRKKRS